MEKERLQKMASINKYELTDAEIQQISSDFDRAIELLAPLVNAEFGDVEPMIWADGIVPVYREDVRAKSVDREEILKQAPKRVENCFAVPRVAD